MLNHTKTRWAAAAATLTLAGGAYAVGHDPAVAAGARHTTLHLTADAHGKLRFNTRHLSARAGVVEIVLRNPRSAGMPHGVGVSGPRVKKISKVVGPGHTTAVTVRLKRGRYSFFCPVPGHAAAGMKGTLTVR